MINYVKRGVLLILLSSVAVGTLQSCKKNSEKVEEIDSQTVKIEKLEKYISVTTGISIDQIKFDKENQEFLILGTSFKEKLDTIQERYEKANEYKLNNEINK